MLPRLFKPCCLRASVSDSLTVSVPFASLAIVSFGLKRLATAPVESSMAASIMDKEDCKELCQDTTEEPELLPKTWRAPPPPPPPQTPSPRLRLLLASSSPSSLSLAATSFAMLDPTTKDVLWPDSSSLPLPLPLSAAVRSVSLLGGEAQLTKAGAVLRRRPFLLARVALPPVALALDPSCDTDSSSTGSMKVFFTWYRTCLRRLTSAEATAMQAVAPGCEEAKIECLTGWATFTLTLDVGRPAGISPLAAVRLLTSLTGTATSLSTWIEWRLGSREAAWTGSGPRPVGSPSLVQGYTGWSAVIFKLVLSSSNTSTQAAL
mmetsp:Transcript_4729/g.11237  ORF Transcript_4729/g.11237 Transcript_4729/m.11237 type:complete len:320 (-) Transcript_4729:374-1333(-)